MCLMFTSYVAFCENIALLREGNLVMLKIGIFFIVLLFFAASSCTIFALYIKEHLNTCDVCHVLRRLKLYSLSGVEGKPLNFHI